VKFGCGQVIPSLTLFEVAPFLFLRPDDQPALTMNFGEKVRMRGSLGVVRSAANGVFLATLSSKTGLSAAFSSKFRRLANGLNLAR
jgi:hypothetical protein